MLARILVRDTRRTVHLVGRVHTGTWHDPYPWIPGTVPEKMIFAELMGRRIEFVFQALAFPPVGTPGFTGSHAVPSLGAIRPDLLIPSIKAVLEVQGTYFHTVPAQEKHDQQKAMEYHAWGWKVYWLWDLDILESPRRTIEDTHELYGGPSLGTFLPKAKLGHETHPGATTADANAVAIANHKRAHLQSVALRVRARRGYRRSHPKFAAQGVVKPLAAPTPLVSPQLRYALKAQAARMAAAKASQVRSKARKR